MSRRWSFPLFVVFGIGFAFAALSAAWVATRSLSSRFNQLKLKSAITKAVTKANQPSDDECRAFASKVEQAFASGESNRIDALFDWDAIIDRALTGIEAPPQTRADVVKGMKQRIHSKNGLAHQFAEHAAKGATLKLLRVREAHGQKVVLFRMIPEGGGINYYEFVPARRPSGKVAAVDLFPYLTSDFVSQSIRQMMIPIFAEQSRSGVAKLFSGPGDREFIRDLPAVSKLAIAVNKGRNKEALAIYRTLHETTKKLKNVLLARTQAALNENEEEFIAAAEAFKTAFPNDPSAEFLNIDYYTAKKDYPKVMSAIDHIDKILGGDPYLNVLRGSISIAGGNYPEAGRFARMALKEEPTLSGSYDLLIQVAVAENKHGDTLELLKEFDRKFELNLGDLADLDFYTEFRKSPEYAQWLSYLMERDEK